MKLKEIKVEIRKDGSFERLFDVLIKEYFSRELYPHTLNILGFGLITFNNKIELLGRIKMLANIVGITAVDIGETEDSKKTILVEKL